MVMIKSTYMDLVNVLVRFNHLPSQEKKIKTTFQIGTETPTTKKFIVEPSCSHVGP